MLHAAQQAGGGAPGSYAVTLHREHQARQARMSRPLKVVAPDLEKIDPASFRSVEILVYPTYVFAEALDREGHMASPNRVREIQNLICMIMHVRRADLLSARRERLFVTARQVAMYLCKRHTSNSFPDIGRRFGGRDHTTVLHAVRRVALMMKTPIGTGISPQWQVGACDLVRHTVNLGDVAISTWGENQLSRARYPARSVA